MRSAESLLPATDYSVLLTLLQKILRGYHSGIDLPKREFSPAEFRFPVVPGSEDVFSLGVWTAEEAFFFLDCLKRLYKSGATFGDPDPAQKDPEMWTTYVRNVTRSFWMTPELDYRDLAVVTFVG